MEYSKFFDHTVLKPDATKEDVLKVCAEAKKYGFASVCVNQYYTRLVAEELKESGVKTCVVVGFPLGASDGEVKAYETQLAVRQGADEIDMVINIAALKDCQYDVVMDDIQSVRKACEGKLLKVIVETCLLTESEIVKACEIAVSAGADYVKTSTGFSTGGAKAEDVSLMRKTVGDHIGVKASGGIRDKETADIMIKAGASRLGTSATVKIVD